MYCAGYRDNKSVEASSEAYNCLKCVYNAKTWTFDQTKKIENICWLRRALIAVCQEECKSARALMLRLGITL